MNIQCALILTCVFLQTHPAERPAHSDLVFATGSRLCKQIAHEGPEAPSGRRERRVAGGAAPLLSWPAMVRCREEDAAAAHHAAHQPSDRHNELLTRVHEPAGRVQPRASPSPTATELCRGTGLPSDTFDSVQKGTC